MLTFYTTVTRRLHNGSIIDSSVSVRHVEYGFSYFLSNIFTFSHIDYISCTLKIYNVSLNVHFILKINCKSIIKRFETYAY